MTWATYFGEIERRRRVMDADGVARCEWIATHTDYDSAQDVATIERMHTDAQAHAATCPVCKARRDYATAHFGPLPSPPQWWRARGILAFPPWVLPAALGALGVGGMVVVRVIMILLGPSRIPFGAGLAAIGGAIVGGAGVGGCLYAVVRPQLARFGALGDYLTGIMMMAGYIGAFLVVGTLLPGTLHLSAVAFVSLAVVLGLGAARLWRSVFPRPS